MNTGKSCSCYGCKKNLEITSFCAKCSEHYHCIRELGNTTCSKCGESYAYLVVTCRDCGRIEFGRHCEKCAIYIAHQDWFKQDGPFPFTGIDGLPILG